VEKSSLEWYYFSQFNSILTNLIKSSSVSFLEMSSFFENTSSFTAWLGRKSESDLKNKLFRIDTKLRLNGNKQALVERIVEATRNLSFEKQRNIFPELASRRIPRPRLVFSRRSQRPLAVNVNGVEPRPRNSGPLQGDGSSRRGARDSRPIPVFNPEDGVVHPRSPHQVSVNANAQPVESRIEQTPGRRVDLASIVRRFETGSFPALGSNDPRTPEQVLQETLEVQAGLIIQSISHAITPRSRRLNSVSESNIEASASGELRMTRSASVSSAEKVVPDVSVGNIGTKLECKVCLDQSVNTVLLPCGHACCCQDCSVKLKFTTWDAKCPICRSRIQTVSMLYFS